MRKVNFKEFDFVMLISMALLIAFGVLIIYSTSTAGDNPNDFYKKQIISVMLGALFFFFASRFDYKLLGSFSFFIYIASVLFLVFTMAIGLETRGSTRWIDIAGIRLQPSELAKPALILYLAHYFSQRRVDSLKTFFGSLVILGIPLLLIFKQPDLGNSIVLIFIWFFITLASGARMLYLGVLTGGFVGSLPLVWHFLKEYQRQRFLSFLSPESDPLGSGYNVIQAVIAVGSGQFSGRGFGRGTQSHLNFLPEQHTDFIFATLAEELGFIGSIILLTLFALLTYRILRVSQNASDSLGTLIGVGMAAMVLTQVLVSVGMNMGLLPITGITLPFVSFGGSSLVSMMLSLGIMQSIYRLKKEQIIEIK